MATLFVELNWGRRTWGKADIGEPRLSSLGTDGVPVPPGGDLQWDPLAEAVLTSPGSRSQPGATAELPQRRSLPFKVRCVPLGCTYFCISVNAHLRTGSFLPRRI